MNLCSKRGGIKNRKDPTASMGEGGSFLFAPPAGGQPTGGLVFIFLRGRDYFFATTPSGGFISYLP